jgi:hypothetical protein
MSANSKGLTLREAMLLGAMFANDKVRASVPAKAFNNEELRLLVEKMKTGKIARIDLMCLLNSLGVELRAGERVVDALLRDQVLAAKHERGLVAMRKEFTAIIRPRGTLEEQVAHMIKVLGPELSERYDLVELEALGKPAVPGEIQA